MPRSWPDGTCSACSARRIRCASSRCRGRPSSLRWAAQPGTASSSPSPCLPWSGTGIGGVCERKKRTQTMIDVSFNCTDLIFTDLNISIFDFGREIIYIIILICYVGGYNMMHAYIIRLFSGRFSLAPLSQNCILYSPFVYALFLLHERSSVASVGTPPDGLGHHGRRPIDVVVQGPPLSQLVLVVIVLSDVLHRRLLLFFLLGGGVVDLLKGSHDRPLLPAPVAVGHGAVGVGGADPVVVVPARPLAPVNVPHGVVVVGPGLVTPRELEGKKEKGGHTSASLSSRPTL